LITLPALAHVWLSPEIVDGSVADLQELRQTIAATREDSEKAAAWFEFASTASELTRLMNEEVSAHGMEQRRLLDEAVARAGELGADIAWSEDHERYFYLGKAYAKYLELAPDGLHAVDSRYHLIGIDFYQGDSGDLDALAARAATKRDFLDQYPGFGDADRVAMYLAVDYRDLWRLCNEQGDRDRADGYAGLLREHLAWVAGFFTSGKTADLAREFLRRFDEEAAAAR
jgi:hypothetical protein